MYNSRESILDSQVERILKAFEEVDDNTVLLEVLGALAENGCLVGHVVNAPTRTQFEGADLNAAALIIKLAQESWQTDNTEWLVQQIQEISPLSDEIYHRIATSMRRNRPIGRFVDRFLAKMGSILPVDNYEVQTHFMSILDDSLRHRTSRFTDPNVFSQLNLPRE